jgi:hypothetical protein
VALPLLRGNAAPDTGSMPVTRRIVNRGAVARPAAAAAYDRGRDEKEEGGGRTEGEGTVTV